MNCSSSARRSGLNSAQRLTVLATQNTAASTASEMLQGRRDRGNRRNQPSSEEPMNFDDAERIGAHVHTLVSQPDGYG